MSFITNFVKWVKGFELKKFFKGLVNGDENQAAQIHDFTVKSNDFVNYVKGQLNSPAANMAISFIPRDFDKDLQSKANEVLERFSPMMAKLTGCSTEGTPGQIISCVYAKFANAGDPLAKKSFWIQLAAFSAQIFADGKITLSDAAVAAKFVYDLITKKKTEETPATEV